MKKPLRQKLQLARQNRKPKTESLDPPSFMVPIFSLKQKCPPYRIITGVPKGQSRHWPIRFSYYLKAYVLDSMDYTEVENLLECIQSGEPWSWTVSCYPLALEARYSTWSSCPEVSQLPSKLNYHVTSRSSFSLAETMENAFCQRGLIRVAVECSS